MHCFLSSLLFISPFHKSIGILRMWKINMVQTCTSKLAYDTCITSQVVKQKWRKYASILPEIPPAIIQQTTRNFVNGCWVGIHKNPDILIKTLS
ncbi:hypothetical protein BDA96_05G115600 [Sorghum bicolor]|uniref:DNA-directed RNA polymerase n=2 Tax=Sorghum bicolor TaxID=4558 RepID=A0A921QZB6_SORBI|nr:hypothetical protein BDA96_05G115600 [Sorghum bicolor]KXG28330.1 hypothetical protein SORBI_3005G110200 [Sorghum bicolor]